MGASIWTVWFDYSLLYGQRMQMDSEAETLVVSEADSKVIELVVRLEKADLLVVGFCARLSCDEWYAEIASYSPPPIPPRVRLLRRN